MISILRPAHSHGATVLIIIYQRVAMTRRKQPSACTSVSVNWTPVRLCMSCPWPRAWGWYTRTGLALTMLTNHMRRARRHTDFWKIIYRIDTTCARWCPPVPASSHEFPPRHVLYTANPSAPTSGSQCST